MRSEKSSTFDKDEPLIQKAGGGGGTGPEIPVPEIHTMRKMGFWYHAHLLLCHSPITTTNYYKQISFCYGTVNYNAIK